MKAMFTPSSATQAMMLASAPGTSRWETKTVSYSPRMSTETPLMRQRRTRPPPRLSPRTSSVPPPDSVMAMSTVLGCRAGSSPPMAKR